MELSDFKLIKNRQRPNFMYQYELKTGLKKYQITTMNEGKTFLATIEEKRSDGRYYQEFSGYFKTPDLAIQALDKKNHD